MFKRTLVPVDGSTTATVAAGTQPGRTIPDDEVASPVAGIDARRVYIEGAPGPDRPLLEIENFGPR